jgi:signal transduction histidine kinase
MDLRLKTWPVAALALAGLLALVAVSVLEASRRAADIYSQLEQLNAHHRQVDSRLRRLRSDVHLSGIYIRDYLLHDDTTAAREARNRLSDLRRSHLTTVGELRNMTGAQEAPRLARLHADLLDYWSIFDPLFTWTASEKDRQSAAFLQNEVIPRREAVLALAREIEELNNANLRVESGEVAARHAQFRQGLFRMLWRSLLLGGVVALTAVLRLRVLERRTEEQRLQAKASERAMRMLSQQLVATQEEERKKLSRELHDHVGQMLTALRMELGRIERLVPGADGMVSSTVSEARQLVDTMVRTVRDLALGLRPSMLDDFGLQPAVEWLVRDVERRSGVRVELQMQGAFDGLSDRYRTCIYRAIQEALTNAIRHARADRVVVSLMDRDEALAVTISDDGVGIDPARRRGGLGLIGLEERVRELGGTLAISSSDGRGTVVAMTLPLAPQPEATLARAAG